MSNFRSNDFENLSPDQFNSMIDENMKIIENSNLSEEIISSFRKLAGSMRDGNVKESDKKDFIEMISKAGPLMQKIREETALIEEEDYEEEETNKYRTQILEQCEELHSALNNMIDVHKSMLEKDKRITEVEEKHRNFVKKISTNFGVLENEDADKLAEDIKSHHSGSNLLKEIIERFGFPEYTTQENVLQLLDTKENVDNITKENNRMSAEIRDNEAKLQKLSETEEEKEDLEKELKRVSSQLKKLNSQKEKLSRRVEDLENSEHELREKYQNLHEEYNNTLLRAEMAENNEAAFKEVINNYKKDIEEPKEEDNNQEEVIADLAEQLQQQQIELEESNEASMKLMEVIQKQNEIIDKLETKMSVEKEPPKTENKSQDTLITDILMKLSENSQNRVLEDVVRLSESHQPFEIKLIQVLQRFTKEVDRLSEEIEEIKAEEPLTNAERQLFSMLDNQLSYIEHLADCSGDLQWVASIEERPRLIESATKIDTLLHSMSIVPDEDIIDCLNLEMPAADMLQKVSIFNNRYGKPTTREGKMIYDVLRQCMASNILLRKFAEAVKEQCRKQEESIREAAYEDKMRELNGTIEEIEEDLRKEKEMRKKAEDELENLPIEQQQRIEELESQLQATQNTFDESKNTSIQQLKDTQNEAFRYQKDLNDLIQKQSQEIDRLRKDGDEARLETKKAQQEAFEQKQKTKENAEKVEELRRNLAKFATEANKAIETAKEQLTKRYEKKLENAVETEKIKKREVKERLAESEREKEKIKDDLDAALSTINALNNFKKERLESDRKNLSSTRNAELAAQEAEKHLRDELRKTQKSLNSAIAENKITNSRLKSALERQKRDKEMFNKELSLHKFSAESECHRKVIEAKKDAEKESRKIMITICEKFNDIADLSQPINTDIALSILERVAIEREKYKTLSTQVAETKKILNATSSQKIQTVAASTMRSLKDAQNELEIVKAQSSSVMSIKARRGTGNDWEEWCRRIYNQIGGEGVPTKDDMRKKVEEFVAASSDKKKLIQKIDSLRKQKIIARDIKQVSSEESAPLRSLNPIIESLRFVRRIQRVSGYLPPMFSFNESVSFSGIDQQTELSSFSMNDLSEKNN